MRNIRARKTVFNLAAPIALAAALALIVASCTQQSESPVAPSGVQGGTLNTEDPGGTPSPEPTVTPSPTPPPTGVPCSPGYWKNHESAFNAVCGQAVFPGGCAGLLEAITCNGGPQTGCTGTRRQAAAAALNAVPPGCFE
jgi:hypothetical protein